MTADLFAKYDGEHELRVTGAARPAVPVYSSAI